MEQVEVEQVEYVKQVNTMDKSGLTLNDSYSFLYFRSLTCVGGPLTEKGGP